MAVFRSLVLRHFAARHTSTCARRNLATAAEVAGTGSGEHADAHAQWNPGKNEARAGKLYQGAVLMEPSTLCRSVVQSAKNGKLGNKACRAYVRKAIELRKQLSLKHIAIIVHSFSNAKVENDLLHKLLDGLSDSIVGFLSSFSGATLENHNGVALYNIYSILHGILASGYSNQEMLELLKERSMQQLRQMETTVDTEPLAPFVFEDMAGILHAMAQLQVPLDHKDVKTVGTLFVKLCNKDQSEAGIISHRAFAIIFNVLERLSCHTVQLYQLGAEYLNRHLGSMSNVKDIAMIYCSLVKIGSTIEAQLEYGWSKVAQSPEAIQKGHHRPGFCMEPEKEEPELSSSTSSRTTYIDSGFEALVACSSNPLAGSSDLVSITEMLLKRLQEPGIVTGSVDVSAQSLANVLSHASFYAEKGGSQVKARYISFLEECIEYVMQSSDIDHVSLIYLMKHAIQSNAMDSALLLFAARSVNNVGMLAGPLEFSQHITNLKNLSTHCKGSKMEPVILAVVVDNMLQFDKRLNMPRVTVRPQPQRKRTLRDLIEAASQKPEDVGTICVYNDLYDSFSGDRAFVNSARVLSAISEFSVHKAAVDLAQKLRDIMARSTRLPNCIMDIDSIGAALTALYRFRMKSGHLLEDMEERLRRQIDSTVSPLTLVQILFSFAKFGCPANRDVNRGIVVSKGIRRATRSQRWRETQSRYENVSMKVLQLLTEKAVLSTLNAQLTVNSIFAITLNGMAQRAPSCVYGLLKRLNELSPDLGSSIELQKQLMTCLVVLEPVFTNRNRLVLREIRRLKSQKRNCNEVAKASIRVENITLAPLKPASNVSGLHRDVWKQVKSRFNSVRSELRCKHGIYYTDIVIRKGAVKLHVEVDGPTHFYQGTQELMSISKLKHAILRSFGNRVVHVPYYAWEQKVAQLKL